MESTWKTSSFALSFVNWVTVRIYSNILPGYAKNVDMAVSNGGFSIGINPQSISTPLLELKPWMSGLSIASQGKSSAI
jgi:hypothetical protein